MGKTYSSGGVGDDYLLFQASVITECSIDALQDLCNMIGVITSEASGDDISVHDDHLYMVLREAQLLQQVVTAT